MPKPICTILAGRNGSGKSFIYEKYRPTGDFVNADEIQKSLPKGRPDSDHAHQPVDCREGRFRFRNHSQQRAFDQGHRASERSWLLGQHDLLVPGYRERNVERVRSLVADGGHDIPEEAIRRQEAAFENLPRALHVVDEAVLINNSRKKPVIVATMEDSKAIQVHYEGSQKAHSGAPSEPSRGNASRQRGLKIVPISRPLSSTPVQEDAADLGCDHRADCRRPQKSAAFLRPVSLANFGHHNSAWR